MEAIFYATKRAHHSALKFGRAKLSPYGLTPARFDLLFLIAQRVVDNTQRALRIALGYARATISEMLASIEARGWIIRTRDTRDRRTHLVTLTAAGLALVNRAHDECVNSGDVQMVVDAMLAQNDPTTDPYAAQEAFQDWCTIIRSAFGDFARFELYAWHPDEYLADLMTIETLDAGPNSPYFT